MDAKIAGFYTCYDAYFCKIFTYLCKSSLERRFMKKIMNEKLTITTSNPVRARFYEYPRFTYPWHFHSEYEIIYLIPSVPAFMNIHVSRIRGIFIVSMKLFMWKRERGIVWWVTALSPIQKVI